MKIFLSNHKEFLIGLLLTISLLWPLFRPGFFTHHDDVQTIRLYEMNKCIADRQIPCRWVPDLGGLYGYPLFNYYAPLPYYVGEISYLISGNLIFSAKTMFAISFLGSYIFMFLLAQRLWGKKGGSIAAIFYAFAPYHAVDFYVRGAMGEMWALMFFPLIFYATIRLFEKVNVYNMLFMALSVGGLITSHNLSAMLFMPLFLIFAFIIFLKNRKQKFLLFGLFAVILGLGMAAFYFIPALAEKNLAHLETTIEGYFSYTEHFKGLKKLFIERYWGYGASVREVPGVMEDNMLSYQIGWIHVMGWLLAIVSLRFFWKKDKTKALLILFSSVVILGSVFMINPRSEFVWLHISSLKYLQFPWRFLLIIIFFISLISGSIFSAIKNQKVSLRIWLALIVLVVAMNFSYFRPEKFLDVNDQQLLSGQNWDKQIKRSIFDYLPIYAKQPPAELATSRYEILTGDVNISNFMEGTNWIYFKANVKSHTIIRLSQYYFPEWKIFIDGKETKIDYKSSGLGLMTIIIGEGQHEVNARLYDTQIRTGSNFVTLWTMIASAALLLSQLNITKRWWSYYRKRID